MIAVGRAVRLSLIGRSNYGNSHTNPYDQMGVVTCNDRDEDSFVYEVEWPLQSTTNVYHVGEIELVCPDE